MLYKILLDCKLQGRNLFATRWRVSTRPATPDPEEHPLSGRTLQEHPFVVRLIHALENTTEAAIFCQAVPVLSFLAVSRTTTGGDLPRGILT